MKRFVIVCICILISFSLTYAQTKGDAPGEQKTEETQSGQGRQMPMMDCPKMKGEHQMMCPMMGQGHMMGGPGMAMRDMQYMILNILKNQQKMIRGLSAAEKKELIKETDKMMDRMEKMMFEKGMMGHTAPAESPGPEMQSEPSQKGEPAKADPHGH